MPIYMDCHYVEGATRMRSPSHSTLILPFRMSIGQVLDLLVRRGPVHGLLSGRLAGPGNHQASPPGVARPGPRTRSCAQPITNGLAARVPAHTLSPPVADRGQGRVGGGRRGAHRHGGAGLDRPGRLGPPRRRTLPDLSDLAGRRRRQATQITRSGRRNSASVADAWSNTGAAWSTITSPLPCPRFLAASNPPVGGLSPPTPGKAWSTRGTPFRSL
jgi:hypothetical protein